MQAVGVEERQRPRVPVLVGLDRLEERRMESEQLGVRRRRRLGVVDQVGDFVELVDGADRLELLVGADDDAEAVPGVEERLAVLDLGVDTVRLEPCHQLVELRSRGARREEVASAAVDGIADDARAVGLEQLDPPRAQTQAGARRGETGHAVVAVLLGAEEGRPRLGRDVSVRDRELHPVNSRQHALTL